MTTDNFTEFTEVFNKAWDDSFSDIPGEITYSIIFNKEKENIHQYLENHLKKFKIMILKMKKI